MRMRRRTAGDDRPARIPGLGAPALRCLFLFAFIFKDRTEEERLYNLLRFCTILKTSTGARRQLVSRKLLPGLNP